MKCWSYLLLLTLVLQFCSGYSYSRYQRRGHGRGSERNRHHQHHHHNHQNGRWGGQRGRKAAVLLPPPTSESEEGNSTGEQPARGLRGQANVLATLQKSQAKCTVEGSYGIEDECSKYTDCPRAGLIPSLKYCPSGKFFDHLQRICIKSSEAKCKDLCKEDGHMLADAGNTHGYLKCMKGVPMPIACSESDQVFSFDKQECVAGADADVEESSEDDDAGSAEAEDEK